MRIDQGQEATARISITFKEKTHAALVKRAKELGHPNSISAVTRRVVEQAIEYGLLEDRDPAAAEQFYQKYYALSEELLREYRKEIARQHQKICEYETALHGPYKGDQAWRDEQAKIKRQTDG